MSISYMIPVLEAVQDGGIITPQEAVGIGVTIMSSMLYTFMIAVAISWTGKILTKEQKKPIKLLKYV